MHNLLLLLALMIHFAPTVSRAADCEVGRSNAPKASGTLAMDLKDILEEMSQDESRKVENEGAEHTSVKIRVDKDELILPGKRVGPYDLGVKEASLEEKVSLRDGYEEVREDYRKILVMEYVAKRWIRRAKDKGLEFFFDPRTRVLREVFIQSDEYQTVEGWKVGRKLQELNLDADADRIGIGSSLEFIRMKGITLRIEDGKIRTIILTTIF